MTSTEPRGIRNNNPGNIEVGEHDPHFIGEVQPPDEGFLRFVDPTYGLRAIIRIFNTYIVSDGCKNLSDIIYRWAPPAQNDTATYLANISEWTQIDPSALPDLKDPEVCSALMQAITRQENGIQPYSFFTINKAVTMALQT